MKAEEITIAEILKEKKYKTAAVGKWHLGHSIKPQKSFDMWFPCQYGGGAYYAAPIV